MYLRPLDDEVVVYLESSFETHLIDDIGYQILEAVQQMESAARPCSLRALSAWLLADSDISIAVDVDPYPKAEAMLTPLLSELLRIGALTSQA